MNQWSFKELLIIACLGAVFVALMVGAALYGDPNVHGLMFIPIGNGVIVPIQY